ncbi:MAG: hypothetical protein NTV05_03525 [Acidobacteria bacterium]|nr:hypothetical protein [Acidobacteriota bacterium]
MRIKDRYFGAKRHGDAALSGSLSIHHARWVSTRNRDVTEEARARVQQGRLDLPVDPHELGPDPWKHQPKELVVTYSVGDGPILTISAKDYDRLQIP